MRTLYSYLIFYFIYNALLDLKGAIDLLPMAPFVILKQMLSSSTKSLVRDVRLRDLCVFSLFRGISIRIR